MLTFLHHSVIRILASIVLSSGLDTENKDDQDIDRHSYRRDRGLSLLPVCRMSIGGLSDHRESLPLYLLLGSFRSTRGQYALIPVASHLSLFSQLAILLCLAYNRAMTQTEQTRIGDMRRKFSVILVRPEKPENIGLVARCMKNTGFHDLRLVGVRSLGRRIYSIAVHAEDILEKTRMFDDVPYATEDCHLVFAATSKKRKNFELLTMEESVSKMHQALPSAKIGLLFGCERTGLTSEELRYANFVFTIPQVSRQPSYNLSSAVLLVLFHIFGKTRLENKRVRTGLLTRKEQDECIRLILERLEERKFIYRTNKRHMTERIYELIGRLSLTRKDRSLLLALFSKGVDDDFSSR